LFNVKIQVILVDSDPSHFAAQTVSQFITYDMTDHKQDDVHARNIIQLLSERNIVVDGCVTFWEDCGPLAALICDLLDFNGPGFRAAQIAKKKSATQQVNSRLKTLPFLVTDSTLFSMALTKVG
jgi:carnosine synthase